MTLIVALRGTDGIVLAADSRATVGDPAGLTAIKDDQVKIFPLSRYCGVGIAGASELATKVLDELRTRLGANSQSFTDDVLQRARDLVKSRYDDWFSKFKVDERPALVLTIAGYQRGRNQNDPYIPRTYLLSSHPTDFAPQLFPDGNCLTGIPQYAIYLMHRFYDASMSVAELTRLAAYLVTETASQDPKVGGPIRLATITPAGGFMELDRGSIDEIVRTNDEQSKRIKQFFMQGGKNGQA